MADILPYDNLDIYFHNDNWEYEHPFEHNWNDDDLDNDYWELGDPLSDVLAEGREWDTRKKRAQDMYPLVLRTLGLTYGDEMRRCSQVLLLQRDTTTDDTKIHRMYSCRRRWCPICAWRKSLKQWALLVERLPALVEKHGPVRWILLTLTVRNCPVDNLRDTVKAMIKGFRELSAPRTALGRKWPATAWLRALEVTFPRPGEAHPHFHCLLAVKPGYFKGGVYVSQAEWVNRWQSAMKLDYRPVVDIRKVKPLSADEVIGTTNKTLLEALGGVQEVAKYCVKPAEQANRDALRGLMSLRYYHFIKGGGWLRGIVTDRPDDYGDAEQEADHLEVLAKYRWDNVDRQYRQVLNPLDQFYLHVMQ